MDAFLLPAPKVLGPQGGSNRVTKKTKVKKTAASAGPGSRSDFAISIYPRHVKAIVEGGKDHEYRKYRLPATRMWIYETAPISAIRYQAVISKSKKSGELKDCHLHIERNRLFNEGTGNHPNLFAHEILELNELKSPLTLASMMARGWIRGPPQKYCWMPNEMVTELEQGLKKLK